MWYVKLLPRFWVSVSHETTHGQLRVGRLQLVMVILDLQVGTPSHDSSLTERSNTNDSRNKHGGEEEKQAAKSKVVLCFTRSAQSASHAAAYSSPISTCKELGPLVDDAAPYSEIGEMELFIISKRLAQNLCIEDKPAEFVHYDSWQYNSGKHASFKKTIIALLLI